ncbi:MAG TPA: DUF983 domain-containing protein [Thermodesulfobacteriota bacterium]
MSSLQPLFEVPTIGRVARVMWLVLRLRCPACGLGPLSDGPFRMRARCSACHVAFERLPGEFTGGMGLNSLVTCSGIAALSIWVGVARVPYGLWLVALFAAVFPIAFYRHSRALWIGIIHIAGFVHRDEGADPEPVVRPWPEERSGRGA